VIIQIIMVGIVIAFPVLVTHYKKNEILIDPSTVEINIPMNGGAGGNPFGDAGNPFGNAGNPFGEQPPAGAPLPDFSAPDFSAPAQ
jgi:hypothetical protein